MDAFFRKRLQIAGCWASSRIAVLDKVERYEDSYAISEEFREWIVPMANSNFSLNFSSVLKVPQSLINKAKEERFDPDEILEI